MEAGLLQLLRRDVDRDAESGWPDLLPLRVLLTRRAQHPLAHLANLSGLLRQREELIRREQPELRVQPAQQRLCTDDALASQIELWLVEEPELAGRGCAAEARLQHHAAYHRLVHLLAVELEAIAPALLGLVHRRVGLLDQVFRLAAVGGEGRDPDAGRHEDVVLAQGHRVAEYVQDLAGDLRGMKLVVQVGEQHPELIAAQPGGRVALAQNRREVIGDAAQQPVAGRMAQRVVHELEAVEVDVEDG